MWHHLAAHVRIHKRLLQTTVAACVSTGAHIINARLTRSTQKCTCMQRCPPAATVASVAATRAKAALSLRRVVPSCSSHGSTEGVQSKSKEQAQTTVSYVIHTMRCQLRCRHVREVASTTNKRVWLHTTGSCDSDNGRRLFGRTSSRTHSGCTNRQTLHMEFRCPIRERSLSNCKHATATTWSISCSRALKL